MIESNNPNSSTCQFILSTLEVKVGTTIDPMKIIDKLEQNVDKDFAFERVSENIILLS